MGGSGPESPQDEAPGHEGGPHRGVSGLVNRALFAVIATVSLVVRDAGADPGDVRSKVGPVGGAAAERAVVDEPEVSVRGSHKLTRKLLHRGEEVVRRVQRRLPPCKDVV